MTMLNRTLNIQGRDYKVPMTYNQEGGFYVYTAPTYKIRVSRHVRSAAWEEFDRLLRQAVELEIRNKL